MKLPLYQVDAFAERVFTGNPAAVVPLDGWLGDDVLQGIAAENNLSETAFLVRGGDGFGIRWFTPAAEVELCGHATLASAFVAFVYLDWPGDEVRFDSRFSGRLVVTRSGELLTLDFPARPPRPCVEPAGLAEALGAAPVEVLTSAEDLLALFPDEAAVAALAPDFRALGRIERRGIIVTAPSARWDFVSRFFAPQFGIPEDPVTGSAHCVLAPYWSKRLGRTTLRARQISRRGGDLLCEDAGDRVRISGRAVPYLEGTIRV